MIESLFIFLIGSFIAGAVLSLIFAKQKPLANNLSNSFAMVGSAAGILLGGSILLFQNEWNLVIATSLPLFSISLHLDMLAGYFMLLVGTIGLAGSFFGIGYMRHYFKAYNSGAFGFFYNFFLLSLFLVVTASNSLYFIFVWEIMTLTSFFLVMFKRSRHDEAIDAGVLYFVMTHIGTMCLLISFLLLYSVTHTFEFSGIALAGATIPVIIKNIVFVLMLIGFGMKAGIIPLHLWLPKAHSAAPSHVSALMSGVMIKMGILMLFRFFFDIIPGAPLWWGIVIIIIGAISALLGVLYALSEHDLKRLLAYHSIENIGIILLGLGSSLIFMALNLPLLAVIAAVAGLFHVFNHGVFKSLLFFGSGSVIGATGTHNMEKYGGLIKTMPYTALFFLIGAIAISGLPPFNGFASEWLTFQSLFSGITNHNGFIQGLFIFASGMLALTGGLAAACFVKVVGITFLARPRDIVSEKAKESSWFQIVSMGLLAALCLIIGLSSGSIVTVLKQLVYQTMSITPVSELSNSGAIVVQNGFAKLSIPALFLGFLVMISVIYLLTRWISRKSKTVRDVTWDCGYTGLMPQMEITATGFSTSLITIFKKLFQPVHQNEIEYVDDASQYFTKSHAVHFHTKNVFEIYFQNPLQDMMIFITKKIKQSQTGNLNLYIMYIFLTLIGLLFWVKYS